MTLDRIKKAPTCVQVDIVAVTVIRKTEYGVKTVMGSSEFELIIVLL